MFKPIKHEQPVTTYCDGSQHVTIAVPQNAYAYETYGISTNPCDCAKEAPVLTSKVQEPQSHDEFEKL
jgi:hypothetical protein